MSKLKANKTGKRSPIVVRRMVVARPRGTAQMVKEETTWFYEHRGRIEVIHWCKNAEGKNLHAVHIGIPWRILMDSARHCRPEETKAKRHNDELCDGGGIKR